MTRTTFGIHLAGEGCPTGIERDAVSSVPLRWRPFIQQDEGLFYALNVGRKPKTHEHPHGMLKLIVFHVFIRSRG